MTVLPTVRDALRRHPRLSAAFALALAVALAFLVALVAGALDWRGREEPLAPWMTVGYVGRSEGVNPRLIDAAAGFPTPEEAGHPLTLAEIAARRGVPVGQVYAEVEAALRELRDGHGGGQERSAEHDAGPDGVAGASAGPGSAGARPAGSDETAGAP